MDEHTDDSVTPLGQPLCFLHAQTQTHMCIRMFVCTTEHVPSYLVEALQPLFDLSQCRVRAANFDLRVLPLGVQTVSYNSARIAARRRNGESDN